MITALRALSIAVAFLTVLPAPVVTPSSPREDGLSLACFPLVGLLLGGLLALLWLAAQSWPPLVAAAILLATWAVLTGALHLDGLADSADAWLGGIGDRERTLAIMQDPRCGTAAVVAVVIVLVLKFAALVTVVTHGDWAVLVAAPLLARAALVVLFVTTPYVRAGGIMHEKIRQASRGSVLLVAALATLPVVVLAGQATWVAAIAAAPVAWLLRRAMLSRLGGTTGDTGGALVEMVETAVLLVVAVQVQPA